jgi:hypothetical protein
MHMHPTVTHAAADHRRQDYLTEAAVAWHHRTEAERLQVRRRIQLLWRITAAVDRVLTWLTREFTSTPQAMDLEPRGGRPLSVYGPH